MSAVAKTLPLFGGGQIPTLGLGTFNEWQGQPGTVRDAVKTAIDEGYRLFDCAWVYETEAEVGEAIEAKIKDGTITREDVFVTTKLWCNAHRREAVRNQLNESLKNLKVDYIDLYLVHWPISLKECPESFSTDENGKLLYEYHDLVDTWKGMEDAVDAGLVKNIGISNFNSKQVQKILDNARIKPVTNQIEIHPYLASVKLVEFCQERSVTITAYSPLCRPNRSGISATTGNDPVLLEDPVVQGIAEVKRKTPAQVILRFLLQRGLIVIPKSVTPARIRENFQVFDFELSNGEMEKMLALDKNYRTLHKFALDKFTKVVARKLLGTRFQCDLCTTTIESQCFGDHPEYPFGEPV